MYKPVSHPLQKAICSLLLAAVFLPSLLLPVASAFSEDVDVNPAAATTDVVLDGPGAGGGGGGSGGTNEGDPDDYDRWLIKIWISLVELRLMTLF